MHRSNSCKYNMVCSIALLNTDTLHSAYWGCMLLEQSLRTERVVSRSLASQPLANDQETIKEMRFYCDRTGVRSKRGQGQRALLVALLHQSARVVIVVKLLGPVSSCIEVGDLRTAVRMFEHI